MEIYKIMKWILFRTAISAGFAMIIGLLILQFGPATAHPPLQATPQLLVTVEPQEIRQGQSGLVRVLPLDGSVIQRVQANFESQFFDLYPSLDGDWVGFISVSMEGTRGNQPLDVYVWIEGSAQPTRQRIEVPVVWGAFETQDIQLSYDLEALLDPATNEAELNELARVHDRFSTERFFINFVQPVPGPSISNFGGIRNYNNNPYRGRHTGVDFRATTGTPVAAAANGRVIFAQHLPIHGNHIIIDHGWGILTGYSHLNEMAVVPGQLVRQGDIIGAVGATGRTQGPHLHWEVVVNGEWVDPSQFMTISLPPSIPTVATGN
jgi:hypothetical protein